MRDIYIEREINYISYPRGGRYEKGHSICAALPVLCFTILILFSILALY